MEKYSNTAKILIKFRSKFNANNIELFFLKLTQNFPDLEIYNFWPENSEQSSPQDFIAHTLPDELRAISILWRERGLELSFYRGNKDEFSIFMDRFGNYFDMDIGCLDGETMLDIARYLTGMLDICEDLTIKNIEYDYDNEDDVFFIKAPTAQALSVALGCPLFSPNNKTYHVYIKTIINNMQNSTAITSCDMKGNPISHELFYNSLVREGSALQELKDYEWRCAWHGYDVMIRLTPYDILTIQPIGAMKMKEADGVSATDVGFYTRFLLEICNGVGILELKTYF